MALEDLLSDKFTIIKTDSAEAALHLMEEDPKIAVVLVDQRMPMMQGDEFVAQISHLHPAQRIMVTGYADLSAVVRAVNDGRIFAYVTKPWNGQDLRAKVEMASEQFCLGQELAREKKLLDDLMNHSPDGIYFKDRSLQFLRANGVLAHWLGQDVNDLVGKRLTDLVPAISQAAEIEREERRGLEQGKQILSAVRHVDSESGGRWLSERKATIRAADGEILGLVGISRDITEQRELEQQLVQSQKMEAVGRLAGGVAHDFNNLLLVIQSYADLVLNDLQDGSKSRGDMVELLAATERATALTRQLLTFSRRKPVIAVQLDVNQVVTEVEKMLSRLVDASILVRVELTPGPCSIRGDTTQIEQVLLNLTINARDAMPEGGEIIVSTHRVHMAFRENEATTEYLCLAVRDSGTGMSPELQKSIFEPFFTTKAIGKGTGLGLSTVYGIVTQWDGEIRVESQVGVGTCFKLYFPLSIELDTKLVPSRPPMATPPTGSETILVVEDDKAVRRVTARVLREKGYHVLEAGAPSEARDHCAAHRSKIDLLLSDINMPQMNGIKLAEELVATLPSLRVLFMSGYSEGTLSSHSPIAVTASYLEKPFSPATLAVAVRHALSG